MTCLRIAVARVQHYGASGGTRFLARDDFLCTDRDTRCGQLPLILNNNYGRGRYETKRVHRDCEHRMYLPAQSFSEKEPLLNLAVYAVPDVLLVCLPLVMLCPVVLCVRVPSHSQKRICLHCELYRFLSIYFRSLSCYGTISHEAAISARCLPQPELFNVDVASIATIKDYARCGFWSVIRVPAHSINLRSDTLLLRRYLYKFGRTPESTNVLRDS